MAKQTLKNTVGIELQRLRDSWTKEKVVTILLFFIETTTDPKIISCTLKNVDCK